MKKTNILDQITANDALSILKTLAARNKQYELIIKQLAREFLSNVDIEDVASDVFDALDMLDVDDLYSSSGSTRYGYVDPNERSWEMFEEALEPFEKQLKKYYKLSMFNAAKIYCMGILKGIFMYDEEGGSEFADWVTDAPGENFQRIFDDWKKEQKNPAVLAEMENFIKKNCHGI